MGNGVNVGAAYYVLRSHLLRDPGREGLFARAWPKSVLASPKSPDEVLEPATVTLPPSR